MSLDATTLAAALEPTLKTAFVACGAADNATLDAFMANLASAIAGAVVDHIKSNAVVSGTATGAMGGGPGVPIVGTVT